jgi:hypothetical protein
MPKLKRLHIFVPDPYDLVLSKLVRATAHDLQQIRGLPAGHPLDPALLVGRYLTEMTHAISDRKTLDQNLIVCIEDLFGETARVRAERALDNRGAGPRRR